MSEISLGFIPETLMIPLEEILPLRKVTLDISRSRKFQQIKSSIEEIGLIEPLSLSPKQKTSDHYLLLDGHIRLIVLRELGQTEAPCLIAKDDEAYTYNSRINRLSTIQEHYMIKRAIERGVSKERLAKALSVDVSHMSKKSTFLMEYVPKRQRCWPIDNFLPI